MAGGGYCAHPSSLNALDDDGASWTAFAKEGINLALSQPKQTLYGALAAVLVSLILRFIMRYAQKLSYRRKAEQCAREAAERRIEFLKVGRAGTSPDAIKAVQGNPEELRVGLAEGKWSVYQVVCAALTLCLQTSEDGDNSVCDVFPDCLERAKALDERRKKKEPLGPLFGVPFSVKENYHIAGMDATAGIQRRVGMPMSTTSPMVQALINQHAIPVVRTNIPQTMLTFECSNPIYGETNNPHRKGRCCGGSSGGEAVLHARYAVPFGLGGDIGGSIRIPAHFCGTCGLKPTSGRVSRRYSMNACPGQTHISATGGPMAPTVDGVVMAMRHLCSDHMFNLDGEVPRIPFNEDVFTSKNRMRIGYFKYPEGFMFMKPTPACLRAVEVAKRALQSRGHELVEIEAPDMRILSLLYYAIMSGDGGSTVVGQLENQDVDPRIKPLIDIVRLPQFIHSLARWLPENKITKVLSMTGRKSVCDLWQYQLEAKQERTKLLQRWEKARLDALVCVSSVMPAGRQGTCSELTPTVWPTFIFNLLNLPAGVVPVTRVTAEDDSLLNHYRKKDTLDTKMVKSCMGSQGLPVTAQVVGMPWQEEKCLRVMKEIETVVGSPGPVGSPF